jgi:hypothetical protein
MGPKTFAGAMSTVGLIAGLSVACSSEPPHDALGSEPTRASGLAQTAGPGLSAAPTLGDVVSQYVAVLEMVDRALPEPEPLRSCMQIEVSGHSCDAVLSAQGAASAALLAPPVVGACLETVECLTLRAPKRLRSEGSEPLVTPFGVQSVRADAAQQRWFRDASRLGREIFSLSLRQAECNESSANPGHGVPNRPGSCSPGAIAAAVTELAGDVQGWADAAASALRFFPSPIPYARSPYVQDPVTHLAATDDGGFIREPHPAFYLQHQGNYGDKPGCPSCLLYSGVELSGLCTAMGCKVDSAFNCCRHVDSVTQQCDANDTPSYCLQDPHGRATQSGINEAVLYYQNISRGLLDPTTSLVYPDAPDTGPASLEDWLNVFGFASVPARAGAPGGDCRHPASGESTGAWYGRCGFLVYYNRMELQLGRLLGCSEFVDHNDDGSVFTGGAPTDPPRKGVACFVSNFGQDFEQPVGAMQDALTHSRRKNTVCITWRPSRPAHFRTSFWAFRGDDLTSSAGLRQSWVALDRMGARQTPLVCSGCHGGVYAPNDYCAPGVTVDSDPRRGDGDCGQVVGNCVGTSSMGGGGSNGSGTAPLPPGLTQGGGGTTGSAGAGGAGGNPFVGDDAGASPGRPSGGWSEWRFTPTGPFNSIAGGYVTDQSVIDALANAGVGLKVLTLSDGNLGQLDLCAIDPAFCKPAGYGTCTNKHMVADAKFLPINPASVGFADDPFIDLPGLTAGQTRAGQAQRVRNLNLYALEAPFAYANADGSHDSDQLRAIQKSWLSALYGGDLVSASAPAQADATPPSWLDACGSTVVCSNSATKRDLWNKVVLPTCGTCHMAIKPQPTGTCGKGCSVGGTGTPRFTVDSYDAFVAYDTHGAVCKHEFHMPHDQPGQQWFWSKNPVSIRNTSFTSIILGGGGSMGAGLKMYATPRQAFFGGIAQIEGPCDCGGGSCSAHCASGGDCPIGPAEHPDRVEKPEVFYDGDGCIQQRAQSCTQGSPCDFTDYAGSDQYCGGLPVPGTLCPVGEPTCTAGALGMVCEAAEVPQGICELGCRIGDPSTMTSTLSNPFRGCPKFFECVAGLPGSTHDACAACGSIGQPTCTTGQIAPLSGQTAGCPYTGHSSGGTPAMCVP